MQLWQVPPFNQDRKNLGRVGAKVLFQLGRVNAWFGRRAEDVRLPLRCGHISRAVAAGQGEAVALGIGLRTVFYILLFGRLLCLRLGALIVARAKVRLCVAG